MTIDEVAFAPIATYEPREVPVLLRTADGYTILGARRGHDWLEYVDGELLPKTYGLVSAEAMLVGRVDAQPFEPVEWAECPEELIDTYAFG